MNTTQNTSEYRIVERLDGWHVESDGSTVVFADRWSAEQYFAQVAK
jgi:hypothetical protein